MQFEDAIKVVTIWRQRYTVVLATGVFDVLHIEHIRFLTKAKLLGDKLIVGIETDNRVKQIKGPHRPIHSQAIRLEQLQALKPVDQAFLLPHAFNTNTDWKNCMLQLQPHIYAVSSHSSYLENKQRISESCGVRFMIVHDHNPAHSTTEIETQLRTHYRD